ncbi:OmpA family protein [Enterobacillus tribolii]|uniref:OOP family OmpA-OmpF porin n=1 Tax=Enterobacillus tribolii TaxID=1487935 RepID=A0A370Q3S6_9GAMM|nr:OmpA family protein [Enterobacillus tribolii]MBW7981721.1 OmpA family protein [Enterobacillus tribolii]RDK83023.1 OOP family OmpA-OmpF porin [Enterobacillus tribolii]
MKATRQTFKHIRLALCVAVGLSAFAAQAEPEFLQENALSSQSATRGGAATVPYSPVATVVPAMAQVVMYYPEGREPAAVYVDRELQSALLPGEFTVFCVAPGVHTIESYFNDQPLYQGKQNPHQQLSTGGGQTYFVQVNAGSTGTTAALADRGLAESKLASLYKHQRIVNRASQVQACEYVNGGGDVLLRESVLFRFGKGNQAGILPESRSKVESVMKFVGQANRISEFQILGYTDAIGSREANQKLSEARANTVKGMLMNKGINPEMINNTSGLGVAPSAEGCSTKASQQSAPCNVESRRVDILVRGN